MSPMVDLNEFAELAHYYSVIGSSQSRINQWCAMIDQNPGIAESALLNSEAMEHISVDDDDQNVWPTVYIKAVDTDRLRKRGYRDYNFGAEFDDHWHWWPSQRRCIELVRVSEPGDRRERLLRGMWRQ